MKYPANNTGGVGEQVDYTYTAQGLLDTAIGTSTYVKGTLNGTTTLTWAATSSGLAVLAR